MRPVSDAFLRTLTGSHTIVVRATVCDTFQTTTTPIGTRIPVLDGDIQLDGTADVRGTLDLTTDGTGMWPRSVTDLLTPYGNEIYVERGIQYSDALVEYVGLGYFRIDEPEQDRPAGGPIRITGSDRMAGIVEAKLLSPVQFDVGASLGVIVGQLITDVYPDAVIVWPDGGDTTAITRSVIATEDRFGFLDDLVRAQGQIWYWDHLGQLVIKDIPSANTPVFAVQAGKDGVLMGSDRRLTRVGVYNAVVATSSGADTVDAIRAVAIDTNPNSPTFYGGRFGKVPMFYTSDLIVDSSGAQAAAAAQLQQNIGLAYTVNLSLSPNPALEPYDCVSVRHASNEGVEFHVIDTLTIPLTANTSMSAMTRQQTLSVIGSG